MKKKRIKETGMLPDFMKGPASAGLFLLKTTGNDKEKKDVKAVLFYYNRKKQKITADRTDDRMKG